MCLKGCGTAGRNNWFCYFPTNVNSSTLQLQGHQDISIAEGEDC